MTTISGVNENLDKKTPGMKEIRPGVWRLKVYAGRHANGSPIQHTKTVDSGQNKDGAGIRLAEREIAKMRTKAAGGTGSGGNETFGWLVGEWLDQCEPRLSPTTMREYRRIADKVVIPNWLRSRRRSASWAVRASSGGCNRLRYATASAGRAWAMESHRCRSFCR